MKLFL